MISQKNFLVIWLRLRQAINRGAKVVFFGHFAPEISPYLSETVLHAPGNELDMLGNHLSRLMAMVEKGKKGAFFVGRQYLNNPHRLSILAQLWKAVRGAASIQP